MDLEDALKAARFLDQISLSVKRIIFAQFPGLTDQEKEEIDQEVKLKLLKMAARGKKIDNLRSYVWKMVCSTALDVLASRSLALCLDDLAMSRLSPLETYLDELTPEYLFEEKELLAFAERAIDSLPPRRRAAVLMNLQGLDLEETALYLGESMNAARHLLYRGLEEVREKIAALIDRAPSLPNGRAGALKPRSRPRPRARLEWNKT